VLERLSVQTRDHLSMSENGCRHDACVCDAFSCVSVRIIAGYNYTINNGPNSSCETINLLTNGTTLAKNFQVEKSPIFA
jgi:hypothetical protein